MMRNTLRRLVRATLDTAEGCGWLVWLVTDHVWRRLTGRPSLFEEAFTDLDFGLTEDDLAKPYDPPGSPESEEAPTVQRTRRPGARTKQTGRC